MPAYYDGPDDIYYEPSESEINDWNIHNDHQGDNEEPYLCGWCDAELNPDTMSDLCDDCANEYDRANPHPLDTAEMEELEDRSAGLEDPWWRRP